MRALRATPDAPLYLTAAALTAATALILDRLGPTAALAFASLPLVAIALALLVGPARIALFAAVFVFPLSGISFLAAPVPFGGANLRFQDLIVALALGSWAFSVLLARVRGEKTPPVPASPVLGWPLVAFGVLIVIPLLRGHYAYGAHVLGQPLRLIAYAGIVVTLAGATPARVLRLLRAVFYTGTVVSILWAIYYIATGGSQSASVDLSTGGSRPLAISTSLYCAGALFLALLTVRTAPSRARSLPHLVIAGLGLIGVVLGFGRGVFAAVAIVLAVFLVASKGIRRGVLVGIPLALPVVLLAAIFVMHTAPAVVTSFQHRISAPPSQDANVIWRERANAAVLAQVREQPIVGVGFGRGSSFYIDVRSSNGFLVPFRQDIGQDPHDGYLFLLAGGGILALGSFLALIAVFTIDAWRRYRGSTDDTERLLIMWVGATLFCFLFEASSGTMFEFPSDLLPIWALLVLPGVVPLRSRLGGGLRRTVPVTA
jgi:O-antigen ligase